jgi:hypothetical protein
MFLIDVSMTAVFVALYGGWGIAALAGITAGHLAIAPVNRYRDMRRSQVLYVEVGRWSWFRSSDPPYWWVRKES